MDTKNRLTNHLLKVAKKHRILTYPVLALVALISVFSYFFNWSTGAGKRVVAIVMVMVMLVSQSYFLTSSATEVTDDTAVLLTENNSQGNPVQPEDMQGTTQDTEPKADTSGDNDEGSPDAEVETPTEATTETPTEATNVDAGSDSVDQPQNVAGLADDSQEGKLTIKVRYNNGASISALGTDYVVTGGVISSSEGSYTGEFNIQTTLNNIRTAFPKYTSNGCYEFETDFYLDEKFSTKLSNSSSVSVKLNNELSGTLDLYAKRNPVKYRVKINNNIGTSTSSTDVTYTPSDGLSENADGYFYVPIDKDFAISGISRTGYTFNGCTGTGATASVAASSLTVTKPSDLSNVSDIEVMLNWNPKTYKIQYDTDGDGNVDVPDEEAIYDSSDSRLLGGTAAAKKTGYTFDKWVDGSGNEYEGGSSVINYQNLLYYEGDSPTVVLKPVYVYDKIVVDTDKLSKTYSFGDVVSGDKNTIVGHYTGKDVTMNGNFTYHLSNAGNLTAYNLKAEATTGGIVISSIDGKGICQTTGSGSPITLTFHIEDKSADPVQTSDTFTISIQISPKVIKLEPPSKTITKTYDGTTDVLSSLAEKTFNVVGENGQPVSGVTVDVSGGKYNSKNVSEATKIVYDKENAVIHPPAGVNSSNYVLDEASIPASIEARDVTVIITPKKDKILAGEEDPEYTISLKSPNSSTGIIEGDSESDVIGGIEASSNRPQDNLLQTGTYKFTPIFKGLSTNYKASMDISGYGSFTVEQESPDGKYSIGDGTTSGQDGWMRGDASIVANADSGYDEVWISKDGSSYELFNGTITQAETGKTYKIYLRNSKSNAQTSVANIGIKVDGSKPVYKGYKVTNNNPEEPGSFEYNVDVPSALQNGGLYFPGYGTVLDFGTYMKTQMTLEIKYEDIKPGSGLGAGAGLYYSLFGSSEVKGPLVFNEDGVATVSINKTLVADADTSVGVIRCYATDVAGNKSDVITLSPNGSDVYEWSIESIEPTIGTLAVYHGDSKVAITNTENYYSDCVATVSVGDSLSGLYKLVWNVNGTEYEQRITGQSGENTPYNKVSTTKEYALPINQTAFPSENLTYTVSVTAVDNAGNESKSNEVQFKTDDVDPELVVSYDDKVYTSDTTISFKCWDILNGNKNTSGIKSVYVTGPDGITNTCHLDSIDSEGKYEGYFEIIDKGVYTLYVEDNAGNITKWEKEIKMISREVPACPTVTVTPEPETDEEGNEVAEYWYNSVTGAPTITIGNVTETSDGTPTETYYRHFKNDETAYDDVLINASEEERAITIAEDDEGIHTFKHWSESASGVKCEDADNHVTVLRYDGTAPKIEVANVPEESSGSTVLIRFTVSDDISGVNKDAIQVLRNGKNYDATIEETENGYVGSFVVKETGNYEVCASDIAGNKANIAGFTPMSMVVNPVNNITTSKVTISANVYKGTADVSSAPTISIRKLTEEEYRECENTLANQDENGNWSLSSVFDGLEENTVYVYKVHAVSDINEVLEYEGYLRTASSTNDGGIIRGTVGYPEGTKLPDWNSSGQITVGLYDGNICIAATVADAGGPFAFTNVPDGTYNIVATDGVYTKSQGVTMDNHVVVKPGDVISLILSGQNTSVVITSPETPKVTVDNMDSIFLYDTVVNFNDADRALIEANGTVEFRLYATLTSVVDVSKDELAVIQRVGSNGKIVAKYLNLSLEKITTDASGNVDRTQVSELSNGASITITIPLQDLAGKKGIEVVRIHDGSGGLEGYRYEVDLDSNPNTFTLTSNKFSTYAILYSPDEQIDEPSTQEPSDNPSKDDPNANEPDKNNPASDGAKPIAPNDKTAQAATTSTSFGSVGSGSGSAKTGDMTPVAALTLVMMIALGGAFTLRKKIK